MRMMKAKASMSKKSARAVEADEAEEGAVKKYVRDVRE